MRGWVYVMSNKSMPGLVKVGYSTKDPDLRAQELNHTGSPHPYVVDYEALVQDPYEVEQRTHVQLFAYSEGKEWFRCTAEVAIAAIKHVVSDEVLHENFRKANRSVVEAKRHTERLAAEQARIERERETNAQRVIDERVALVRARHEQSMHAQIVERPFWQYWLAGSLIALLALAFLAPNMKEGVGSFLLVAFLGSIVGFFIQSGSADRQKKKPEYRALEESLEREVAAILNPRVNCTSCSGTVSFDALKLAIADRFTAWQCPTCKAPVRAPHDA
jgi:hypothetical protein